MRILDASYFHKQKRANAVHKSEIHSADSTVVGESLEVVGNSWGSFGHHVVCTTKAGDADGIVKATKERGSGITPQKEKE